MPEIVSNFYDMTVMFQVDLSVMQESVVLPSGSGWVVVGHLLIV